MRQSIRFIILSLFLLTVISTEGRSEDWPMWRHDAGRSAASSEQLSSSLSLRWTRQLVAPQMAWPEDPRIHFDATPEPISTGSLVFIASSANDSVTALDLNTGVVRWKVFADGPVRFAPVVAHQQVYFGADDGFIYCVEAESGTLLWRKSARPAERKAIGSERVISVWPIRGGPVLYNGQIYFTSGVWPFEGVLLYEFPVTANQQHAPSFQSRTLNSLTPQGYTVAAGGRLYLPCGRGISACLDLESEKMLSLSYSGKTDYHVTALGDFIFHGDRVYNVAEKRTLNSEIHRPVNGSDGLVGTKNDDVIGLDVKNPTFVDVVDRKGKKQRVQILPVAWKMTRAELAKAVSETSADWKIHLQAGSRYYGHIGKQIFALEPAADSPTAQVSWHATIDSPARSMIAANGRLIVVSQSNRLYCFMTREAGVKNHVLETTALATPPADGPWAALAKQVVAETTDLEAYCLVAGIGNGELVDQLLAQTRLRLVVVDPSAEKVAALRDRCDKAGLYGTRLAAQAGELGTAELPVYFASVIVAGEPFRGDLGALYRSLRPYGGSAYLPTNQGVHQLIAGIVEAGGLPEAKLKWESGITRITRAGALAGSSNWTHEYGDAANSLTSSDELVKAPLGGALVWWTGRGWRAVLQPPLLGPEHGGHRRADVHRGTPGVCRH
jgi:outer membrane protein assembly factor BamB